MRKIVIGSLIVLVLALFKGLTLEKEIIPNEAIRLRILANSNSSYDQQVKGKIRDELQSDMYSLLKNTSTIEGARNVIKSNMTKFNNDVNTVLKKENYNLGYTIDFGSHYFPSKEYKGITYNEGYYESLLIKLGEGKGDNWWCVLFPPLCLLEAEESTDVEYKFFVAELIDKYF